MKTVFITGIGRGLGKALALKYASEGWKVCGCDVDEQSLQTLREILIKCSSNFSVEKCDVTNEEEIDHLLKKWRSEGYSVDLLINNAGITDIALLKDTTTATVERIMSVNFMGYVRMTKKLLPDLIKQKGKIIAISSVAGFAPLYGRTAYAASKHAVKGFFETLRTEVKSLGIHVMIVYPGFIHTGIKEKYQSANQSINLEIGAKDSPEKIAALIFRAEQDNKRHLITGIGKLSYAIYRISPRLYEYLMLRRMKP